MLGRLNIVSLSLAVGAMGQLWFRRLFPNLPAWVVMGVIFLPWITAFVITFCKQPLFGPRQFRFCLIFVICWYSGATFLAEIVNHYKPLPPDGHFTITVARILMYFGWISFIPFVRAFMLLSRLESEPQDTISSSRHSSK